MKKKNLVLLVSSIFIILVLFVVTIFLVTKLVNNKSQSDSVKFKEEYESKNGEKNFSGEQYKKLEISKNNPIKYATYDELIDVIKNKTGIIYLGFPECPWCRSALPVLLDVAQDKKVNTIYYMNIKDERDVYTVKDDKLVYDIDENGKEKKGTEGYFKLLDVLSEHLTDYKIMLGDKTYEVGEKRIFAPSVIFVKDGEVLSIQVSTVATHENPYEELTKAEYKELYTIYEDYIVELYSSTCSTDSAC